MQLLAGRTGQEYNRRKNRNGAFWEDRYHATAVQTDDHLTHCMAYMDLNMVRAGVVPHPSEWEESGCREIQSPRRRYGLIDHQHLMGLLYLPSVDMLQRSHIEWIDEALRAKGHERDSRWTQSIAVGSRTFVEGVKDQLRIRAKERRVLEEAGE
jgi:putative transposase